MWKFKKKFISEKNSIHFNLREYCEWLEEKLLTQSETSNEIKKDMVNDEIVKKINEFKRLGGLITIRNNNDGIKGELFNEIILYINYSDELVINKLDEKISLLKSRPWLITSSVNLPQVSICETCVFYKFELLNRHNDYSGNTFIYETCANPSYQHFKNVLKNGHEIIKNCNDYKNKKTE